MDCLEYLCIIKMQLKIFISLLEMIGNYHQSANWYIWNPHSKNFSLERDQYTCAFARIPWERGPKEGKALSNSWVVRITKNQVQMGHSRIFKWKRRINRYSDVMQIISFSGRNKGLFFKLALVDWSCPNFQADLAEKRKKKSSLWSVILLMGAL